MIVEEILVSPMISYIVIASMIITQLVKSVNIPKRIYPLISFVFSALMTFLIFGFVASSILPAIIVGGAGAGIYDIGKRTILGK